MATTKKNPSSAKEYLSFYADLYKDDVFMQTMKNGVKVDRTYINLRDDCYRLASSMLDMGLTGKHMAIFSENRYEFIVCLFASMLSGAPFMPVYVTMPEDKVAGMVAFADIEAAFVSDRYKPMVESIAKMGVTISTIIDLDGNSEFSYDRFIEKGDPTDRAFYGDMDDDRIALMCFTSGTSSGKPKCVTMNYRNLLASAHYKAFEQVEIHREGSSRSYSPLPMFHLANLVGLIVDNAIPLGNFYATGNDPKDCFRHFLEHKPYFAQLVPALAKTFVALMEEEVAKRGETEAFAAYCKECDEGKYTFEERREITKEYRKVVGGNAAVFSVVGARSEADMIRKLTYFGILTGCDYGLTECSPTVTTDQSFVKRAGSVGKMLPYMTAKLVDGELYVKGDHVMKGYYKNPEATKAILSEDGWLCTGDLADIDEDGYVFIRGRAGAVAILSNGENIDTEELELQLVQSCDAIEEIVVLADKKNNNDTLGALIYARPGCDRETVEQQLLAVNKKLPVQQRIIRFRLLDKPFERNEMLKIKRFLYRDAEI